MSSAKNTDWVGVKRKKEKKESKGCRRGRKEGVIGVKMFFGSRSSRRRASGSPLSFLCAAGAGQGSRWESAGAKEGGI